MLVARVPKEGAPFKLGQWGTIINVAALVWGGSMIVNFLWPRSVGSCSICNPPLSALPNINLGTSIGSVPIFEATLGVILIVGAIYYFIAQRNAPDATPVQPASSTA